MAIADQLNGLALLQRALADLTSVRDYLAELVNNGNDRARNAYAEGALEVGPFVVGTTPTNQPILEANPRRRGSTWMNNGTSVISLGLGSAAPVVGRGITLQPNGGSWDGRISGVVFRGSVFAISSSAAGQLSCVEI